MKRLIIGLSLAVACGRTVPERLGANGRPCYGNNTCDPGLVCTDSICVPLNPIAAQWCPELEMLLHFENDTDLGESDTFAADASGSLHNARCFPPTCPTWTADGRIGGAFVFDGDDDHLVVDSSVGLELDEVTWMAWVRLDALTGDPNYQTAIASDLSDCGDCDDLDLGFDESTGTMAARVQSTLAAQTITGGPNVEVGAWYHLTLTAGPSGAMLYVDGVPAATLTAPTRMGGRDVLAIGGGWGGTTDDAEANNLSGTLDEVMVFGAYLTQTEVLGFYLAETPLRCR